MPDSGAEAASQDAVLRFLHDTLGLEHLHYGLFEEKGPDLGFAELRVAQTRYATRLLDIVSSLRVSSLLDVGCGFGTTAKELSARGHQVSVLSPDSYQLEELGAGFVSKYVTRFDDFEPDRRFELILMSESSQYINLSRLFDVADRALAKDGYLLIADYFVRRPLSEQDHPIERSGHPLGALRAAAADAGFQLQLDEDITKETLPTLEIAARFLDDVVTRALRDLDKDFEVKCAKTDSWTRTLRRRFKYRSLRLAVRQLRQRVERRWRPRVDPEAFLALKEYRILLFARGGAATPDEIQGHPT